MNSSFTALDGMRYRPYGEDRDNGTDLNTDRKFTGQTEDEAAGSWAISRPAPSHQKEALRCAGAPFCNVAAVPQASGGVGRIGCRLPDVGVLLGSGGDRRVVDLAQLNLLQRQGLLDPLAKLPQPA